MTKKNPFNQINTLCRWVARDGEQVGERVKERVCLAEAFDFLCDRNRSVKHLCYSWIIMMIDLFVFIHHPEHMASTNPIGRKAKEAQNFNKCTYLLHIHYQFTDIQLINWLFPPASFSNSNALIRKLAWNLLFSAFFTADNSVLTIFSPSFTVLIFLHHKWQKSNKHWVNKRSNSRV